MSINDTIGCVNHDCAKCKAQSASNQELTKQDFGGDCDTPPKPWSAIWVAWNSEDGFTFWNNEKQASLWSATDSNEWPVQYAMQKAQPTPVPITDAQIVDTYCKAPHQNQHVAWFAAGVRYAEAHHNIRKV